ncbi:unnamed protein product, partial [Haemonchus placei]|uniref:Uncharacterized protein n=1 Tax=Haemonchus placei TaxID=6290 RepID=A0A158QQM8_HAEPC
GFSCPPSPWYARRTRRGRSVFIDSYHVNSHIHYNFRSLVSVGTQQFFGTSVNRLVHHLQASTIFCNERHMISLNKFFYPTFEIDWCRTRIRNVTLQRIITTRPEARRDLNTITKHTQEAKRLLSEAGTTFEGYTFWESVVVFPLIAVLCIVLILVLSIIFFGRREGQQWRDYKTAKEQLEEYVSVRQSQRHLRELSVQRQLLLMTRSRHQSSRCGIHSFLQPKNKSLRRRNNTSEWLTKCNSKFDENNVGKQTVAEAALQCGSSLHLYRNPLESEIEEENENDSLIEKI